MKILVSVSEPKPETEIFVEIVYLVGLGGHAGALRGVSKERRVGKGRELSKNTLYHLYAISHCIHSINLIPPLQNKEYFIMTKGIIQ